MTPQRNGTIPDDRFLKKALFYSVARTLQEKSLTQSSLAKEKGGKDPRDSAEAGMDWFPTKVLVHENEIRL